MSSLVVPAWAWALLAAIVLLSISIDLFAHRGDHVDSKKRALVWTLVWVGVSLAFNVFVALWFGLAAAEEFLAAYLLEKSLSVDNLFVFLLVFGALSIPVTEQRRVLTWGILGAILSRGVLIFAGAAAVQRWHALTYVFGGILVLAAVKLLRSEDKPSDEPSAVVVWLEKHLRWTRTLHGHRFFVRIDGKRVATHWASCERLADRFPALTVDADALYVVDGKVWTSAGVTTGIDMALALVEADLGAATANLIARHFVLYARRPGYQSQFSPLLQAQTNADAPFAALIDWMQDNLDKPLDVPALARRAGLSERSFYRKFTDATGKTPAHFVEGLRLDAARTLLAKGLPLKTIAGCVGLRSSARLGQAFERRFGMAPSLFREIHAAA